MWRVLWASNWDVMDSWPNPIQMSESQVPSLREEASIPSVFLVTLWLNESCSFTGKTRAYLFSFIAVVVKLLTCVQLFVTHRLQHTRLPCPSPFPIICSNSYLLSWWCHPTASCSVVPFSSCLQSFLVSGPFPMSWRELEIPSYKFSMSWLRFLVNLGKLFTW